MGQMMKKDYYHNSRSSNGYTLLELLVVIGISAMLLITAVSLFVTTLRGGGRTSSSEYAKQSGQYAINQITFLIRNARKPVQDPAAPPGTLPCRAAMNTLSLLRQNSTTPLTISLVSGRLSIGSGQYITPADLVMEPNGATPLFSCRPSGASDAYGTANWNGSAPVITVSFNIRKGTVGASDTVNIPFATTVTMRNY